MSVLSSMPLMLLLLLVSMCMCVLVLFAPSVCGSFSMTALNSSSSPNGWNGRSAAGLFVLPYPITYSNWSYIVNSSVPGDPATPANTPTTPAGIFNSAGQQVYPYSLNATMPANSLYLVGGGCGHNINPGSVMGDPDVWASPDNGVTWTLIGGAHGFSGTYGEYVSALSGSTPAWQGGNPAAYTTSSPWSYTTYPGSVVLHDSSVNGHIFYIVGGDYYVSSGVWRTSGLVQTSGYPKYGQPLTSSTGQVLNAEGLGWTSECYNSANANYDFCAGPPTRTSAAGTMDSVGTLWIMNGIYTYDTNDFPQILHNDVWFSPQGGLIWEAATGTVPWSARMESTATTYYSSYYSQDVVYSMGGCSTYSSGFNTAGATMIETGYNDVYVSVNRGLNWYSLTQSAAWSARCGLTSVATSAGVLVIVGGRSAQTYTAPQGYPSYFSSILGSTTLTDIWTSLDGGYSWVQLSSTGGRDRPAITLDVSGYLHVVGGRVAIGEGYNSAACPSDSYISTQTFNSIASWIGTVNPSWPVPANIGLTYASLTPAQGTVLFSMNVTNPGAGFYGRSSAGLFTLPYPLTYNNWSYVVTPGYTSPATPGSTPTNPPNLYNSAGVWQYPYPGTTTAPSNSLYLVGGACGHYLNTAGPSAPVGMLGDPDVWTSPDNGVTWNLMSGPHGITGLYGIYVAALSGSTPYWQGSNPSAYITTSLGPWSYSSYPNSNALHDNVNHKFYMIAGESYAGTAVWRPSDKIQSSGYLTTALKSSTNTIILNAEGTGWTDQCLNPATQTYVTCGAYSVRSSAGATIDSKGYIYLINGISAYDNGDLLPEFLLTDVWVSTTAAFTWFQASNSTPWRGIGNGRMESTATTFFSQYYQADVVYSMGGCSTASTGFAVPGATLVETGYNDVYASTNLGSTWYAITTSAQWSPRCGLTSVATSAGVLVVVGGRSAQTYTEAGAPTYYQAVLGTSTLTDIWTSLNGGISWYQLSSVGGRDRAAITLDVNGYLHIVSGRIGLGWGYDESACPADAYISSFSFNNIESWITTIQGLSQATVPTNIGLRSIIPVTPTGSSSGTSNLNTGGSSVTTGTSGGTSGGSNTSSSSSLSGGAIAGIVIGSVFGALILCGFFICCFVLSGRKAKKERKAKNERKSSTDTKAEQQSYTSQHDSATAHPAEVELGPANPSHEEDHPTS